MRQSRVKKFQKWRPKKERKKESLFFNGLTFCQQAFRLWADFPIMWLGNTKLPCLNVSFKHYVFCFLLYVGIIYWQPLQGVYLPTATRWDMLQLSTEFKQKWLVWQKQIKIYQRVGQMCPKAANSYEPLSMFKSITVKCKNAMVSHCIRSISTREP